MKKKCMNGLGCLPIGTLNEMILHWILGDETTPASLNNFFYLKEIIRNFSELWCYVDNSYSVSGLVAKIGNLMSKNWAGCYLVMP